MKKYTWSNSKDDELWMHDSFDTVDECIEDAKGNYGYKVGETIAVGETKLFKVSVDAVDVIDRLEEQAYEECGEASEGWISCKNSELDKLSQQLTNCVNSWLKETGQEPAFYQIHSISIETIS